MKPPKLRRRPGTPNPFICNYRQYEVYEQVIFRPLIVKRMRFPIEVILVCIRWYAAYPLSYRHLEEMMEERGVSVDHSTVSRWTIRFLPLLKKIFRKYKRSVGRSWRMDETYSGQRYFLQQSQKET